MRLARLPSLLHTAPHAAALVEESATGSLGEEDTAPASPAPAGQPELSPRSGNEDLLNKVQALLIPPTVTVSIDGATVRLVVFQGSHVVAWATLSAESAEGLGGSLAERIHAHLRRLGIRRARYIADLPLNSTMVRTIRLTRVPQRFIQDVALTELAEILPFSPSEMHMEWQSQKEGDTQKVVATAVLNEAVHARVHALKSMGAHAQALYPRTVALVHATGLSDGILVHAGREWAELVFVHHNAPLFVHRVEFAGMPAEESRVHRTVAAILLLRGYVADADVDQDASPEALPVRLVGPLASDDTFRTDLANALRQEVQVCAPDATGPAHFSFGEYAVNVGLARADRLAGRPGTKLDVGAVPTINMLPPQTASARLSVRPLALLGTLALLGIASINVSTYIGGLEKDAVRLGQRVETLEGQARMAQLKEAEARVMTAKLATLTTNRDLLSARLDLIKAQNNDLFARLRDLTETALPQGLVVTALTQKPGYFITVGAAPDYDAVLLYAANLRATGRYTSVSITRASGGAGSAVFEVEAYVP